MGAYIVIFPDKKYVNTSDLSDIGSLEATVTTQSEVSFELCRIDGTGYTGATISSEAPSDPSNLDYWIDTSSVPHTLKQYSSQTSTWVQIATTYVKISAPNIASAFSMYDGVRIDGIGDDPRTAFIKELLDGKTNVIQEVHHDTDGAGDFLIFVGFIDEVSTQSEPITISRRVPNMDFVIESQNRLWGCRYGTDIDGNIVNEIYASKLGDFKNWNCFMGLSTDSYTASCGTDGQWTGAITHLGYPLFFKENVLHKVYGNYPSNYQIQDTACRGVMKGAGKSLAIVNETLYYKSRNGVCAYNGSLPTEISSAFGEVTYSSVDQTNLDTLRNGAVAGSHNNKYYISMKSEVDGDWHLFVYDASKGLWHKEDNTRVDYFCAW